MNQGATPLSPDTSVPSCCSPDILMAPRAADANTAVDQLYHFHAVTKQACIHEVPHAKRERPRGASTRKRVRQTSGMWS